MKRFKIIYYIVLLLLSVSGVASGKAEPAVRNFTAQRISVKELPAGTSIFFRDETKMLPYFKFDKKENARSLFAKGMRRKALPLETNLLPDFYYREFVTVRCFHDSMIYSLIVRYTISRHTYLHLYQLF